MLFLAFLPLTSWSIYLFSGSPASLKVAPIILKKYYPSAVESAEFTEFLDSLSEDDSLDEAAEDKVAKDTTKNANMKPNEDLEYMGGLSLFQILVHAYLSHTSS